MDSATSPYEKTLILKSNAVEVKIHPTQGGWLVEYEIKHGPDTYSKGAVWMSGYDLKTAFNLSDRCDETFGQGLIDSHGGDVAFQGRYIRYEKCLNIPGPGTGHDGDPNVSIYVDNQITGWLEAFLKQD